MRGLGRGWGGSALPPWGLGKGAPVLGRDAPVDTVLDGLAGRRTPFGTALGLGRTAGIWQPCWGQDLGVVSFVAAALRLPPRDRLLGGDGLQRHPNTHTLVANDR